MDSDTIRPQSLLDYLSQQPHVILNKLYAYPATCLAILRALPALARHYVMRLLFVEQTISQAAFASCTSDGKEHSLATEALSRLNVWNAKPMPGGLPGWLLNPVFRENLKTAFLGGGRNWSLTAPLQKDKHQPDIAYLDNYAMKRWESVLHFMVDTKTNGTQELISKETREVLQKAGLIKFESENDTSPVITSSGFQFLLMDTRSQIWYFLLRFFEIIESRGLELVECLTFLFQLSFLTLGKDYSTNGLSESLLVFLQNLRELGLVYQRKRKDGRFYPTRLSTSLLSGESPTKIDSQRSSFIIVETNYRVYAYTDSPLQIALLALFTQMQYRFPQFVVGILTRESVRGALRSGITAEQITNFLAMNAHKESLKNKTILPPTVVDQIKLWEMERDRIKLTDGTLYSQFNSQPDFELLKKFARDLGVLIWDNPAKRLMVVSNSGHDEVRRFWKRHKKEH